jgi:hypothetical protein
VSSQSIEVARLLAGKPLTATDSSLLLDLLGQAIEQAARGGGHTWLTDDGRRIAAIQSAGDMLTEHERETIEGQMAVTRQMAAEELAHPVQTVKAGPLNDPADWRKGWQAVPVTTDIDSVLPRLARVLMALVRTGYLAPAVIGVSGQIGVQTEVTEDKILDWLRTGEAIR